MNMKKLGYNLRRKRSIYKKIPIKMKLKYCLKKKKMNYHEGMDLHLFCLFLYPWFLK